MLRQTEVTARCSLVREMGAPTRQGTNQGFGEDDEVEANVIGVKLLVVEAGHGSAR